jgi:GDP-4-dehydro-6-deoxy-D-mannose reductase
LDVVRDFLDVRDGVSAFLTLAERGRPGGVYNIASGRGYRVGELLDIMKGLARAPVRERVDSSKGRPVEEMVKIGDPAKLMALGWKPSYQIEKTLAEILDYWRALDGTGA